MKNSETAPRGRKRGFKSDRFRDVLLLSALALLLIFAVWKIFYIREAVAAALGTDEKSVKIYLMKE